MKPYGFEPVHGLTDAIDEWGCTCGPVAIAGALGLGLDVVRPAVEIDGRFRGYMGVRDVKRALALLGAKIEREYPPRGARPADPVGARGMIEAAQIGEPLESLGRELPAIVMVRFSGPWNSVPRAAATYRHLFVYRHVALPTRREVGAVLDINNGRELVGMPDIAAWAPLRRWMWMVLGAMLPERGDGRVIIDWAAEVSR